MRKDVLAKKQSSVVVQMARVSQVALIMQVAPVNTANTAAVVTITLKRKEKTTKGVTVLSCCMAAVLNQLLGQKVQMVPDVVVKHRLMDAVRMGKHPLVVLITKDVPVHRCPMDVARIDFLPLRGQITMVVHAIL